MAKRKTKADLEKELKEANKNIECLQKKNELVWKMYISALDELADIRIREDIKFENEYEYVLSGDSSLSDEDAELYLNHHYNRYKNIKKGLRSEQEILSEGSDSE